MHHRSALAALLAAALLASLPAGAQTPAPPTPAAPAPAAPAKPAPAAKAARTPTAGQMAARDRQKKCGAEWKADKAAGKTAGLKWPQYWSQCNARLKGGSV